MRPTPIRTDCHRAWTATLAHPGGGALLRRLPRPAPACPLATQRCSEAAGGLGGAGPGGAGHPPRCHGCQRRALFH